jgi:regulator of sigma E protease
MVITIIVFVITLLILVLIHELGHFLTAKKFGIKVEEFGFGIPPRAWGKKIGETIYSLNWLPFGGFVRLLGEDQEPPNDQRKASDKSRYFSMRPVSQRIVVVVAGVIMNLLLAFVLFYITLGFQGFKTQLPVLTDYQFIGAQQTKESLIIIQGVAKDSPASLVGLKPGDRVFTINGISINKSTDLQQVIQSSLDKPLELSVTDPAGKDLRKVSVTPRSNPPAGQGPLGIAFGQFQGMNVEYKDPLSKIFAGPLHALNVTAYSGKILGSFISEAVKTKSVEPVSQTVSGPVGITNVVNSILTDSKNPILPYLDFVALLSLNLAIMNILPIPALDGGRFFFLLIEAITRKKVNQDFERWVHTIGMAFLLMLMLLITFSDIKKLFP